MYLQVVRKISKYFLFIKDILFPHKCPLCDRITSDVGLCHECFKKIDFISKPYCNICGLAFAYDTSDESICGECIINTPNYDKALSVFVYDKNSKKLIIDFKHSDQTHLALFFARLMNRIGSEFIKDSDFLISVPLYKMRLLKRKYNQAALISNKLSIITKVPTLNRALIRIKNNVPQASLSRKKRLDNVKGIFVINESYRDILLNKNITLIDDVSTTGSTINECAKILKKAGCKKIYALTVAKTLK